MTPTLERPRAPVTRRAERPAARPAPFVERSPVAERHPAAEPRRRFASPALAPPPASTADRSFTRPANHLASPWRGARCRIRPLGPSAVSSAPVLRPRWRLELEPTRPSLPDRLIGWSGGGDPRDQVRLDFPSAEAALAWAARYGLEVDLVPQAVRRARPRPYAESLRRPCAAAE